MPHLLPEIPKSLKPYVFHGLDLDWEGKTQAQGDCPFCGREDKFYINVENGLWDCKVCGEKGNAITFLRKLWEISDRQTTEYESLSSPRKLLFSETVMYWGICQSVLTHDWIIPGYSIDGKINQLYRYSNRLKKTILLATPEMPHQLYGSFSKKKEIVYICEGPWDGMALWELMRIAKKDDYTGNLIQTSNEEVSLIGNASILSVPGCNVFQKSWCKLFEGKTVILMYDSDHPKDNNGTVVEPAGYAGMRRVARLLCQADNPPKNILYLNWGPNGYDKDRPSGFDVRDFLSSSQQVSDRLHSLKDLLSRVVPIPTEWVKGLKVSDNRRIEIECLSCNSWNMLINSWRKAVKLTDGLNLTLSVMLASVISVPTPGDQLWIKVIGPPSCGKSVLCEAISMNKKYVVAKSTIRGFHSGFKSGRDEDEDNSLIPIIKNKTLVTKDGDSLLSAPNKDQILGEARDLYDSTARTHYRNKVKNDYDNVRTTWILCGTEALRILDASELGERFLDVVIVDSMDESLEDEIGWRVACRMDSHMSLDTNETGNEVPEMLEAKRLTGGYITYLRENIRDLLEKIQSSEESLRYCQKLAEFVSFMRARPSDRQGEKAQRELSFRLISQHVKLAKCLAVVLNQTSINNEVLRRVRRVALDTARGRSLEIIKLLYEVGKEGMTVETLAAKLNRPLEKKRSMLRFLRSIGVVDMYLSKKTKQAKWILTERMERLYSMIIEKE